MIQNLLSIVLLCTIGTNNHTVVLKFYFSNFFLDSSYQHLRDQTILDNLALARLGDP